MTLVECKKDGQTYHVDFDDKKVYLATGSNHPHTGEPLYRYVSDNVTPFLDQTTVVAPELKSPALPPLFKDIVDGRSVYEVTHEGGHKTLYHVDFAKNEVLIQTGEHDGKPLLRFGSSGNAAAFPRPEAVLNDIFSIDALEPEIEYTPENQEEHEKQEETYESDPEYAPFDIKTREEDHALLDEAVLAETLLSDHKEDSENE
jgi:hypothetical protein